MWFLISGDFDLQPFKLKIRTKLIPTQKSFIPRLFDEADSTSVSMCA